MFACVVKSEQSDDECTSRSGAYFPNDLQHRAEAYNYILAQAMGSVRKRTAKFLKDLFFIVFAVDPPMSKILEGKSFKYGRPSISTSVLSSSHPSSWSSILASLPVPSELASSSFFVSCKLRNSDK